MKDSKLSVHEKLASLVFSGKVTLKKDMFNYYKSDLSNAGLMFSVGGDENEEGKRLLSRLAPRSFLVRHFKELKKLQ